MLPQLAFGLWMALAPAPASLYPPGEVSCPRDPPALLQASSLPPSALRSFREADVLQPKQPETPRPKGSSVPEPTTLAIVGLGLLILSLVVRRRRKETNTTRNEH